MDTFAKNFADPELFQHFSCRSNYPPPPGGGSMSRHDAVPRLSEVLLDQAGWLSMTSFAGLMPQVITLDSLDFPLAAPRVCLLAVVA